MPVHSETYITTITTEQTHQSKAAQKSIRRQGTADIGNGVSYTQRTP